MCSSRGLVFCHYCVPGGRRHSWNSWHPWNYWNSCHSCHSWKGWEMNESGQPSPNLLWFVYFNLTSLVSLPDLAVVCRLLRVSAIRNLSATPLPPPMAGNSKHWVADVAALPHSDLLPQAPEFHFGQQRGRAFTWPYESTIFSVLRIWYFVIWFCNMFTLFITQSHLSHNAFNLIKLNI